MNEYDSNDYDDDKYLHAFKAKIDSSLTALLYINDYKIDFQLDMIANVNILCEKYVYKPQANLTTQNLV